MIGLILSLIVVGSIIGAVIALLVYTRMGRRRTVRH